MAHSGHYIFPAKPLYFWQTTSQLASQRGKLHEHTHLLLLNALSHGLCQRVVCWRQRSKRRPMVPDRHQLLDRPFVVPQPSQPFLQRRLAVQETASDVEKMQCVWYWRNAVHLMAKRNASDVGKWQCVWCWKTHRLMLEKRNASDQFWAGVLIT